MPGTDYDNIPVDMRAYPQWVVWRYVERDGKQTKQPINPLTGLAASVTNPDDWSSFDDAVAASPNFDGIGYVFTVTDPYVGIDLDDPGNDPEAMALHQRIVDSFDSYTELSPSGRGVHIIVKAELAHGRRRSGVEIYPHSRFFTMTGRVVRAVPIAERQALAQTLWDECGGEKAASAGLQADAEASLDDAAVVELLLRDPALAALYGGSLSAYSGDHSAGDQALCNALAARSGNRAQVERLWLASPLGTRDKTQGVPGYRRRTIERAFDRPALASVNLSGMTVNGHPLTVGVAVPAPVAPIDAPVLIDAGDWHGQPEPRRAYVVPGWVPAGEVTYLTGRGAAGKSLLTQGLASSTALGLAWLGQSTARSVALYVTCEDDAGELHRRQLAICAAMRVPLSDLRRWLGIVSLTGAINSELAVFDAQGRMTPTPAYHWLSQTIAAMNARFVVLDNVAHLFAGNENIRNQVAAFIGLLNALAKETGAAIVLIGHPNKTGEGYSGSTAWENQVRTRLFLSIPQDDNGTIRDPDARILTRAKANYGRAGEALTFRWYDGAFVRDADMADQERAKVAASCQASFEDEAFLRCLAAATEQKRAVSHNKGTNYAPVMFARMPESGSLNALAMERAMERLFHNGKLLAGEFLWLDNYRKPKVGLKLAGMCGDPPAATPCGDLRQPPSQVIDNACGDPRAATPLYTTYIEGGAYGSTAPVGKYEPP